MKIDTLEGFKKGWFIGDFDPAILKTDAFEVAYHEWKKGDPVPVHYHKIGTEINLITYGKMIVNGHVLTKNNLFTIYPYEVSEAEFLEDTGLVIIKIPSVTTDKYMVNNA